MSAPKTTNYDDYIHEPNNHKLDHIPGNFGLPFIGQSMQYLKDPVPFAQEQYKKYGLLSKVHTIGSKGLLCLGPDLAQQILLDPGHDFSSKMGFHVRVATFFGGSLIMEDFEHHKHERRIAQSAFKNEALKHYTVEINRIYKRALNEWSVENGNTIEFFSFTKNLLLEVAAEIFIGETERGEKVARLSKAFTDCANGLMYALPINLPGFALHTGLQGRKFLEQAIGSLVAKKRAGDGLDMLSHFCREKTEDGSFFSDEEITNQIIFLLFAAHDTTTAAIVHTIYFLARHPEIKERLYQECKAFGKEEMGYDDLSAIPYLQMVFNEVQRARPSVPSLPRRTIREVEMAGFTVPAHTMLFTMPRFTHWMEEYWTEPMKFDPERFAPGREEHKKHPFQFHPFGGGAHKCIGMHFAQMEYKCFIYQFMMKYDFDSRHKDQNVFMQTFPLPKPSDNMPIQLRLRK